MTALRGDLVLPELLGMDRVVSEDAVRRAIKMMDADHAQAWCLRHLDNCTFAALGEPWILDVDTTVKLLYGRQEGAEIGCNPHKPGRPSHTYHAYMAANLRLVLEVDVKAGDEHTSNHTGPGLWALLQGDAGFGNEPIMREAERRCGPPRSSPQSRISCEPSRKMRSS